MNKKVLLRWGKRLFLGLSLFYLMFGSVQQVVFAEEKEVIRNFLHKKEPQSQPAITSNPVNFPDQPRLDQVSSRTGQRIVQLHFFEKSGWLVLVLVLLAAIVGDSRRRRE
ncbi:hypothetical protein [Enterococcus sp. AZ103]|uniref:hypothetical protein n=1 Tax=Enterococcus sp. AZ103 TaxID=2774628 RepID=UPI003F210CF9